GRRARLEEPDRAVLPGCLPVRLPRAGAALRPFRLLAGVPRHDRRLVRALGQRPRLPAAAFRPSAQGPADRQPAVEAVAAVLLAREDRDGRLGFSIALLPRAMWRQGRPAGAPPTLLQLQAVAGAQPYAGYPVTTIPVNT